MVVDPVNNLSFGTLIDIIEEILIAEPIGFNGRLVGRDECWFYLGTDRSQIEVAIQKIAQLREISQARLALEEEPSLGGEQSNQPHPRPKTFDIWAIPLANGAFGHFQVLDRHDEFLDLIRVFDAITPHPIKQEIALSNAKLMFPPVFTLVSAKTARANRLRRLGNVPTRFEYPIFRHANLAMLYPDKFSDDWSLWSKGKGYQFVGKLSGDHRELECLVSWPLEQIAKRIEHRIGADNALARFEPGQV
jgi:hypothetical protein